MPHLHPRRRWRFAFASAVSAAMLATVAGCGGPSQAGHAAAMPSGGVQGSVPSEAASPTEAASSTGAGSPSAAASASAKTATGTSSKSNGAALAGRIRPNVTYHGKATFYDSGNGDGACLFGPAKDPTMIAAMNETDYEASKACGAYVQVHTANGASVTVQVTNLCPLPCAPGQIDLTHEAFAKLADLRLGEVPITWNLISPGLSDPISIRYKVGSSQWWCGIQVINHRNPVARLEVRGGSGWRQLSRESYNYFLSPHGDGCGGAIRVTDIYGEQLTITGIALSADVVQPTRVQFARH